jgi:hypothetical protein
VKQQMQVVTRQQLIAMAYTGKVLIPVDADLEVEGFVSVTISKGSRTSKQNSAIHKYLGMLVSQLNTAGLDMKKVIKEEVEIPWSVDSAKEYLWRPVQKAVVNKDSTTDLDTAEVNKVYEVLSRHLSTKFNITTPFPTWRHEGE